MIFFADANFPVKATQLLEVFDPEHEVRHHHQLFPPQATPDTVWIPAVGAMRPKPAILCGDGRILTRPAEKAALREADLMFFVFRDGWMNLGWFDFAPKLLVSWPRIVQAAASMNRASIFEVRIQGKVELLKATAEWR